MRWQKALWDAVAKNDARLVKKILKMDKVRIYAVAYSTTCGFPTKSKLEIARKNPNESKKFA